MSTTDQTAKQNDAARLPLGEALVQAARCREEGRLGEAEALCRRILEAKPNLAEAEHLLGVTTHQNGKLGEAIEHVRRAASLAPEVALYHANLGEMLRLSGRTEEAVAEGHRAIALKADYPEALSNLGVALYEQRRYEEAAAQQRAAIALNPDLARAWGNLGNSLFSLKHFDEATAAYQRALTLEPNFADGWSNLGTNLHHAGSYAEAMTALRRAIALAPDQANAHSGLGILLLMHGNFGEGWAEYEWRLQSTETKGPRFPRRPWQGESLAGRRIYIQAEQGFGDTIQFARYMPRLKDRAGAVSLRVSQPLLRLMRESLPGIDVLGDGSPAAPADCECAMLSLGHHLKTRLETIPANIPYLRPPEEVATRWHQQLSAMPGLKTGIVWGGRPDHANDFRRSIDLAELAPIFAVPGVSFASLQVGPPAAALATGSKFKIADLSPKFDDFAETAGAIAALDLVIAVDTSVAHLAGALGKPVWVLLPLVTDWRWLIGREDSPWYPTMRLFRMLPDEAWRDVVIRVAAELAAVAGGEAGRLTPFKDLGERRAATADEIIAAEDSHIAAPAPARGLPPAQALIRAEQERRAGRLGRAEDLAHQAMAVQPASAEGAHLLGIIAYQSGKLGEAVEHLRNAVRLDGNIANHHANLCEMCRAVGRIDEAIAAGRRAVEIDPNHSRAYSNLGVALYQADKFDEALDCYDRALALSPDFVEAHSNRGNALRALKRLGEAEPAYRRALELQPSFTDGWNNLGTCLRELKRPEEAEAAYRRALELRPSDAATLDNLALAVKDLDRVDEAADLLRQAIAIDPRSDIVHVHLGSVLLDQKNTEEAAAAVETALSLNANSEAAFSLMGRVAYARGEPEVALEHYRRALALNSELADTYNNMANALKEVGRLEEAQAAYLEALRLDPNSTGAYLNLADSKTFTPDDLQLSAMEALAAKSAGLSRTEHMQLNFALGKAYADLKDYSRSFAYLSSGNAAKRATISYDEDAVFSLFDRIERVFTPELIATKSEGGNGSAMPIFVIGMPRSGTTLVEQIIASHPMVHGAGELKALNDVVQTVRGADGNMIPYPESVPALDAAALNEIGTRYIAAVRRLVPELAQNCERVTDKMPSNYHFAGLIHLALPNAKIIHTVRDPVDTCVSCFSKLFNAEQNHTYDLGELGRYHRRYERLMDHWHRVLPPGRILDVRYEEVVADLESEAKRIITHCGLPWDDRCLSFYETDRPVRTASATQVRKPIYGSAIGRWHAYEDHLAPLLDALGVSAKD